MIRVGFLVLLCTGAFANPTSSKPCANVTAMENFNITMYQGRWFVVEKYSYVSNLLETCISQSFQQLWDGSVKVEVRLIDVVANKPRNIDGFATFVGDQNEAKFTAVYEGEQYDEQWILNTDYDTFSIHFTCGDISVEGINNVWILARNEQPLKGVLDEAHQVLENNQLSRKPLIAEDWKNCPAEFINS